MADEKSGGSAGENQSEVKNVKAEFDRKLGNVDAKLSALEATNNALLNQLQAMNNKAAPAKSEKKLEDVWFDQPEAAAEEIAKRAEERVMSKINQSTASTQKQNKVINELYAEFPELGNNNHSLTKKAVEIYNKYEDSDKSSPMAYRAAVMEAAQELKMAPKSKREDSDSDYTDNEGYAIGGSSGGGSASRNRSRRGDIDPVTKEFAELVGVDLNKPEVKERIKNGHNRKRGYSNWE